MTNEKRPSDETSGGLPGLGHDPESLKEGVFAAWQADHPGGSQEQFDAHWTALTDPGRTSAPATGNDARAVTGDDAEAAILKHRFFEEWIALRPQGTRQQFEDAWREAQAR